MSAPLLTAYVNGPNAITGDQLNTFMQTCDIAAQMRGFIGTVGMSIYARGIGAVNDGMGGEFYWNSTSAGPDDNLDTIVPAGVLAGAWLRQSFAGKSYNVTNIASLRAATSASVGAPICYVMGYYTGADGGEGTFWYNASDTTSADNGGTIIVDAAGRRWYREAGNGPLSVKWFGATGNGTTDDTATIQSAITAAQITRAGVYLPAGNYKVSRTLTVTAADVWITGAGIGSTVITTTATAADVIYFFNSTTFALGGVRDLGITGPGGATAGSAIHISAEAIRLERLAITGTYNGVVFDANSVACRATGVDVSSVGNDSFLVIGGNNQYLDNCTTFQQQGAPGGAGFHVTNSNGGPWLTNCVSSSQTNGLLVATAAGGTVVDLFAVNCDFDDSANNGITIDSSSGGTIFALKFTNCRGCFSGGKGVAINGAGTYDLQFSNCEFSKNVQQGVFIANGSSIGFSNCLVNGNAATGGGFNGIDIDGGTIIRFEGGASGPYHFDTSGNNQTYGIAIQSSFTGSAMILGNDLSGNVTGPLVNASASSAITVSNNLGCATRTSGLAIIAQGATTVTVASGLIAPPSLILVNGEYATFGYAGSVTGGTGIVLAMSAPNNTGTTNVYWEAAVYNG